MISCENKLKSWRIIKNLWKRSIWLWSRPWHLETRMTSSFLEDFDCALHWRQELIRHLIQVEPCRQIFQEWTVFFIYKTLLTSKKIIERFIFDSFFFIHVNAKKKALLIFFKLNRIYRLQKEVLITCKQKFFSWYKKFHPNEMQTLIREEFVASWIKLQLL